jgi:hypothetical protein
MTVLIREHDGAMAPSNIAITCRFDAIGRVHFRSGNLTSRAASRFAKIQTAFLKGRLLAPSPAIHAALSLVLFDGIATESDLSRAITGLDQLYRWDGHVCLDWLDSIGRQNRRHLGPITQAILSLPRADAIDARPTLQALDIFVQDIVRSPKRSYSLELLLLDAQAWLYERLAPPLFAHCIGKAPIAALGRSTLARHESGLAISPIVDEEAEEPSTRAFAYAIGNYFASRRDDQGGWFITELVTTCRRKRTHSNTEDKRRMLRECEALASRDIEIAPTGGLILAWVIDLLQSGTRTKMKLKAITPAKYVGIAAGRLWEAFRGKDIEEIAAADYLKTYLGMMEGLSSSQKRTLASALSSWHFFLTCWFDVPPLHRSLHKWVPSSAPKANLIWTHEMERIRTWLAVPMADVRHQSQLRVAFEIASRIRIRASELLNLRLQNFHWNQGAVTIEIATKAVDGGVKTLAAFRRDDTQSAECVALIEAWCQRRVREGAYPSDYLFGNPHRPDTKYATGLLYADLNRLLKSASGDPTIALHALSHTRISMDWSEAAFEEPVADINPFERESVDAGHASAATGFACYFHLFEEWLRASLDQEIQKHFGIWSCINERVGKTPDAYRQARSRCRRKNPALTVEAFAARLIEQACPVLLLPLASDGVALGEAINPIAPTGLKPLTMSTTLDILNDVVFGHSAEAIALRSNRSPEEIGELGRVAIDVLQCIGEVDRRQVLPLSKHAVLELHACLKAGIDDRIQFQRAGQAKVGHLYDIIASGRHAQIVARGIEAWERCYQRGYISLDPAGAALPFVVMLDAADFPRYSIVVRCTGELEQRLMAAFHAGNRGLPQWASIQLRPGRPAAYLTLASHSPDPSRAMSVGNAGLGMGGVHAVMFAAAVLHRISSQSLKPKN